MACILSATERHESRRIDNQLRGRAGRQGDPGASRFYLSLEDDLMRIFAKEWVSNLLQRLGMEEGVPIESRMISSRIEAAQKAVEGQNFEARKHLLEYDDVMNKQRTAVYGLRQQLLEGLDQKELILEDYVANLLSLTMETHAPEAMHPDQWDVNGLKGQLASQFGIDLQAEGITLEALNRHELGEALFDRLKEKYELKEQILGSLTMRYHEPHGDAQRARWFVERPSAEHGPLERRHRTCADTGSRIPWWPTRRNPSTCSKP